MGGLMAVLNFVTYRGLWLFAVGCWLLAVGYLLLAAGHWLLADGCLLLAGGCLLLAFQAFKKLLYPPEPDITDRKKLKDWLQTVLNKLEGPPTSVWDIYNNFYPWLSTLVTPAKEILAYKNNLPQTGIAFAFGCVLANEFSFFIWVSLFMSIAQLMSLEGLRFAMIGKGYFGGKNLMELK